MKRKLNILTYSLASGGAEKVVSILLWELKNNFDITLFLMNKEIFYDVPKNTKIIYLENSNAQESGIKKLLKLLLLAYKYKKLSSCDISLSFMNRPNYINILAKLFGMRSTVVISERAMPSLQHKNGLQGFINRVLIRLLYGHANTIIANSQGNAQDLKDHFTCQNVRIIPNLFDIKKIQTLSKEDAKLDDKSFNFITIGRLDKGKNHILLIEAMRDIDARLYIIGDGELRSSLIQKVEQWGLTDKVFFLGRKKNPYKYLAKSDCFVFSSNHEGFPNVVLEALTCGLPVISTDCKSGPREILAPDLDIATSLQTNMQLAEYGILIAVGDVEAMRNAMKMIIDNKDLCIKYTQKAKKRASDFDLSQILTQWETLLEKQGS